jgi:hypothetical protein
MTQQISKGVMLSNQKLAIISQLGQDKYTQIYTFLRYQRSKPGDADEQYIK